MKNHTFCVYDEGYVSRTWLGLLICIPFKASHICRSPSFLDSREIWKFVKK